MKVRENFLKSITKNLTEVNEGTGEITTIKPPIKSGSIGLKLTVK